MPLTRPIPDAAIPVVEILRRDVKRPEGDVKHIGICLGYKTERLPGWKHSPSFSGYACPLGLHPKAGGYLPLSQEFARSYNDGKLRQQEVGDFIAWWHEQRDGEAATDAIWPPAS